NLEELPNYVRDGAKVNEGTVLGKLRSPELEQQEQEAESQVAIRRQRSEEFAKDARKASDAKDRRYFEELSEAAKGEQKVAEEKLAGVRKRKQRLVLRAPSSGVIINPPRPEELGRFFDRDQPAPFCSIGDPGRLRVLVPVPTKDFRLIQEDL